MLRPHPQHPVELERLLEWVKDADSILEIGCRYGANLRAMAHAMRGKKIVGVDLPDAEGWNGESPFEELKRSVQILVDEGFDAHLIVGDSHSADTLKRAASFAPFDVVFIDGDHSYKGAKMDWEMYGPLGKTVIFHDISKQGSSTQVYKLWDELKKTHHCEEFIAKKSLMGIGKVGAPKSPVN
jgi:predicted O-methyltransferase YrrM